MAQTHIIVLAVLLSVLKIMCQEQYESTDSKILVNPDNYATNFIKPQRVKPTTAQVSFEPGVPPGDATRPTRPPRPFTRTTRQTMPITKPVTDNLSAPFVFTLRPNSQPVINKETKPDLTKPAPLDETNPPPVIKPESVDPNSENHPGISPPEAIVDPDRIGGVVDWVLGIFGQRPSNTGTSDANNAPTRICPSCSCGITYKQNRIVGGVETQINQYPWMTLLMYNHRFYCGGSVINNKYVLTAAHCVQRFSKNSITAVFLDHDRSTTTESTTFSRGISRILVHSKYGSGGTYNNDIALLQLDKEVQFDGLLKPVCLPPLRKSFSGSTGVVTGWGTTKEQGQISSVLREVQVPILSNAQCRETGYKDRITDSMLCAGYPEGSKDSCQGDSGGPLHVHNETVHYLVGIVSWGEGCAQPNYPGVYTRVNKFVTWINSNTKDACYCA